MVNHSILLHKLKAFGIRGQLLSVLRSYLSNRTQCVKVNNSAPSLLPTTVGVPQGSILAPTLFQVFINDLLDLPLHCSAHGYADDTCFSFAHDNLPCLQSQLNHDLVLINQQCNNSRMVLNTTKSHYLAFNLPDSFPLSVQLSNQSLLRSTTSKLLGLTINDRLTWHDHLNILFKKRSSKLKLFYN